MPLPNRFQTRVSPEPARPSSGYSIFGLLIAVLLAASMLWYVQNLLIPYQRADAAAHGRPRGNLSDLYPRTPIDRKSTRLNSSHITISYAVFCLKKKKKKKKHKTKHKKKI